MNNQKFVWTTVKPLQVLSSIIPIILPEYLCKSEKKKKSAFPSSVFSHLFFKVSEQNTFLIEFSVRKVMGRRLSGEWKGVEEENTVKFHC